MLGSIYALADDIIEEAVYESLIETEGLVVFDIKQVIEMDQWDRIKRGIERAEKSKE